MVIAMIEEIKKSERDKALISILERLADQIGKQDALLGELVKQQEESSKEVRNASLHRRSLQLETERAIDRIQESISRYRSDMLSIVNEQDSITKNMVELNRLIGQATYQFDLSNQKLAEIDDRVKKNEKALTDRSDEILKQTGQIPNDILEASRKEAKLHAETEKRLGDMQKEMQKQLDKLHKDTARRLLTLGDIETSIQTLLIRTEPPEKKPPLVVRLFIRIRMFFKYRFTQISRIFTRNTKTDADE